MRYDHERYGELIEGIFEEVRKPGVLKGGEYSGDNDRLANFRRNAERLGLRMETVWAVYAAKHWDAIIQAVQDEQLGRDKRERLESLEGRVHDLIVHLCLFAAMLDEKKQPAPKTLTEAAYPEKRPVGPYGYTDK